MAVVDLGSNSNVAGATLALTGVAVPSGAAIVVFVSEGNNINYTGGTVADDAGNTYTLVSALKNNAQASVGGGSLFYAKNASALTAGQNITYTKQGANATIITALYATGIDPTAPLDTSVTATATGSSSTPSVTSGTPGEAGELFVGALCWQDTVAGTYAVDSGNGWAVPMAGVKSASGTQKAAGGGGNQVNAGTGTIAFAPTTGANNRWAIWVIGLKAAPATSQQGLMLLFD